MVRHKRRHIKGGSDNFLSILDGIEGGFAIFTGIIAGLSFQSVDRRLLVASGLIGIIVNAFNCSVLRYTTQHYYDELDGVEKRNKFKHYTLPALVEFGVYTIVSIILLLPLVLADSLAHGVMACAVITLAVLFAAGYYRGWVMRTHPLRDALELSLSGAAIVGVGALAGFLLAL